VGLLRRRRRWVLAGGAVVLTGAAAVLHRARTRVPEYRGGGEIKGLVDKLRSDLPSSVPRVVFHEVGAEAGLVFEHFPGTRAGRLPEDMGSGVAVGDVDADSWPDVFLVNSGPLVPASGETRGRSRLFRNLGGGRFEDMTETSGIDLQELGMGAAFLDADGDGDLDLFVTTYGTCRLFENDGSGRFSDVSTRAGLDMREGFWSGVAVADYDRDGALDVYVCNYVLYDEAGKAGHRSQFGVDIPALINPSTFEPAPNMLLRGRGDGTFDDIAVAAGVRDVTGRSLGALFTDLDLDGWPDIYVANDVSDNALFLNRGDGTFEDITTAALIGDYRGAMGLAAADFDGDHDLDVFITHWVGQENALYALSTRERTGEGRAKLAYVDLADRYGVGFAALQMVGWATRFFDYDNDGALDLFVVNGSTIPLADDTTCLAPMKSQLFWRQPSGSNRFHDLGAVGGEFFAEAHVGRGGATLDYDLDGDEDLVVSLFGERARLLRNDGGNGRPSVRLRLREPSGNRFAVGARVEAESGGVTRIDVTETQGSYLSQHVVGELAFGLGNQAQLDPVRVTWPDGAVSDAGPFLGGTLITWTRGERPVALALPGFVARAAEGPPEVEVERRFFAVRAEATRARLAGELDAAIERYRAALALWPGHDDCLYYLAHCLAARGDERGAFATWEAEVAFAPESNRGWMQIGLARLPGGEASLDDLALAAAAFERCHAINPEESRPVVQLGVVALLAGDLARARERFADAAQRNPSSIEARYLGGRAAYIAGDRPAAEALLAEAHALARAGAAAGSAAFDEGRTKSGAALVAEGGPEPDGPLARWRTLASRTDGIDAEYGGG
jgi:hypothetical protein